MALHLPLLLDALPSFEAGASHTGFPATPARVPRTQGQDDPRLDEPALSVVIVNYCQWPETIQLVRQLRRALCAHQGAAEIVVVDNHSPPHPQANRLRRLPGVSLRRWRRNRGFARAVNEGCRLSRGAWVLLLNPDVTVSKGFLDEVLVLSERLTAQEPRTGVVGLHLRNADGGQQLSAGPFPTLAGTLAGLLWPRGRRKYLRQPPQKRQDVPWVTGCGLLVRRDCLAQIGGFDEGFFLYYEDVDFCRRAQAHNWAVKYEPELRLTHHRPLASRTVPPHLRLVTRHALLTYAARHWPRWQGWLLSGVIAAEARARHWWAGWRGDAVAARRYAELRALAAELQQGRAADARRRLGRVVREEERRAEPVRRRAKSQPPGPVTGLPDQCAPVRSR